MGGAAIVTGTTTHGRAKTGESPDCLTPFWAQIFLPLLELNGIETGVAHLQAQPHRVARRAGQICPFPGHLVHPAFQDMARTLKGKIFALPPD